MTLLFAGIALDVVQVLSIIFVFLCYLGGIDPSSWMASPTTILVFFGDLGLRLISRRGIVRLGLIFWSLILVLPIGVILIFIDRRPIAPWAPRVDFPSPKRWLKPGLCFYIDSFLYHLVPHIQVPSSIIQLDLDRWT